MTLTQKERALMKHYLAIVMQSLPKKLNVKKLQELENKELFQLSEDLELLIDLFKRL